jgi:arsenate reductase (thioredoxin)
MLPSQGRGMSASHNVLFLCTGNSARSILAEAILNRDGAERFRAFSAGSFPKGKVHPEALRLLDELGHDTSDLRSKSWDEFASPRAPQIDFIITVCDNAAGETCPLWPGRPVSAHWGIEDPAVEDDSQPETFWTAYQRLKRRIDLLLALPLGSIDELALARRVREIGRTADAEPVKLARAGECPR